MGAPTSQEPETEDNGENEGEPRNPRSPPGRDGPRIDQNSAAIFLHIGIQDFLVALAGRNPFGDLEAHFDSDLALVPGYRFAVAAWRQDRLFQPLDPGLLFVGSFGCRAERPLSSQRHAQKHGASSRPPACVCKDHKNTPELPTFRPGPFRSARACPSPWR